MLPITFIFLNGHTIPSPFNGQNHFNFLSMGVCIICTLEQPKRARVCVRILADNDSEETQLLLTQLNINKTLSFIVILSYLQPHINIRHRWV